MVSLGHSIAVVLKTVVHVLLTICRPQFSSTQFVSKYKPRLRNYYNNDWNYEVGCQVFLSFICGTLRLKVWELLLHGCSRPLFLALLIHTVARQAYEVLCFSDGGSRTSQQVSHQVCSSPETVWGSGAYLQNFLICKQADFCPLLDMWCLNKCQHRLKLQEVSVLKQVY